MKSEDKYLKRFQRNIGILTEEEQKKLKESTVTIAGIGGVGGITAERLTRVGIGRLKIADPEVFTETDLNRQFGATTKTIGVKKVEAVGKIMKEINPELQLDVFPEGVAESNISDFLDGADLVIDAIEFFTFKERLYLYPEARKKKIPVILSGAPAFGSPLFVFSPNGMTMEEFFEVPAGTKSLENFHFPPHKICPKMPEYISPEIIKKVINREMHASALSSICGLAGSLLTTEVIFILLDKRKPVEVPECILIDFYRQELVKMDLSKRS
ncbi:MAG: ThiF family adenylyltransferase [Elusimicrobia bacterium]|nr:ThiF family adenylyltransferase [Elusimicrobiota bacterium]